MRDDDIGVMTVLIDPLLTLVCLDGVRPKNLGVDSRFLQAIPENDERIALVGVLNVNPTLATSRLSLLMYLTSSSSLVLRASGRCLGLTIGTNTFSIPSGVWTVS
jgi:hypothetical protein